MSKTRLISKSDSGELLKIESGDSFLYLLKKGAHATIISGDESLAFSEAVQVAKIWDETKDSFRLRLRDPSSFVSKSFRTIEIADGIKSIIGSAPDEKASKVQSVVFEKSKFKSMQDAREWIDSHEDIKKSLDGMRQIEAQIIQKSDDETRTTTAVVISPYRVDAHGDFTTPKAVRDLQRAFNKSAMRVRVQHAIDSSSVVVSSSTLPYPSADAYEKAMRGELHDVFVFKHENGDMYSGDWVASIEHTKEEWELVKKGLLTGYSPSGLARRVDSSPEKEIKFTPIELDFRPNSNTRTLP